MAAQSNMSDMPKGKKIAIVLIVGTLLGSFLAAALIPVLQSVAG